MRRAARIDANQTAIVSALLARGCGVQSLAAVGCGCPDLLVYVRPSTRPSRIIAVLGAVARYLCRCADESDDDADGVRVMIGPARDEYDALHNAGRLLLLEIKDGDKKPSEQQLTHAQKKFHRAWPGPIATVHSVAEALAACGIQE